MMDNINAGHNPPLLKKTDGSFAFLKEKSGLVVGAMEGIPYRKKELLLEKDDVLFLYTDGATEAINEKCEQYSEARLQKQLDKNGEAPVADIIKAIQTDIEVHAGSAEQFDDITMLVLRWNGTKNACER